MVGVGQHEFSIMPPGLAVDDEDQQADFRAGDMNGCHGQSEEQFKKPTTGHRRADSIQSAAGKATSAIVPFAAARVICDRRLQVTMRLTISSPIPSPPERLKWPAPEPILDADQAAIFRAV